MRIFIDGSSSAYGLHDTAGGWAGRLQTTMNERIRLKTEPSIDPFTIPPHCDVINSAQRARTIRSVRKWLPTVVHAYNSSRNIGVFLFNAETFRPLGSLESVVPPDEFSEELKLLLDNCEACAVEPIFLGTQDFNPSRTQPYKGISTQGHFLREDKDRYNLIVEEVVAASQGLGAVYIDVPGYFRKKFPNKEEYYELLASDGVHFRDRGHELIHDDLLLPVVDDKLRIGDNQTTLVEFLKTAQYT